jgi:hypothetical protein
VVDVVSSTIVVDGVPIEVEVADGGVEVTDGAEVVVDVWARAGRVTATVVRRRAARVGTAARRTSRDTA